MLGFAVGVIWRVADGVLGICKRIARSDFVPFYAEGALSFVFLPMIFGAIAAVIFHSARRNLRKARNDPPSWKVILEGMLFGAVGTVVWYVVPLAVVIFTGPLLFIASVIGEMVVIAIDMQFYRTFADTPLFLYDVGSYAGGVIAGEAIGLGLGVFGTGVARELWGKRPWGNRKHTIIGASLGAILGAVYGAVFVWVNVIGPPGTFD